MTHTKISHSTGTYERKPVIYTNNRSILCSTDLSKVVVHSIGFHEPTRSQNSNLSKGKEK